MNLIKLNLFIILLPLLLLITKSFAFNKEDLSSEQKYNDTLKIAFIPFFHKDFDDQFICSLKNSKFKLAEINKTSENFRVEYLKNNWLKLFIENISENIKSENNLYFSANKIEIEQFKVNNLNSDYIYLHGSVESRKITKINNSGNETLSILIAVYNLKTGDLVFKRKVKSKTKFENVLPDENEQIRKLSVEAFTILEQELLK